MMVKPSQKPGWWFAFVLLFGSSTQSFAQTAKDFIDNS